MPVPTFTFRVSLAADAASLAMLRSLAGTIARHAGCAEDQSLALGALVATDATDLAGASGGVVNVAFERGSKSLDTTVTGPGGQRRRELVV